jgi:molybdopterin-containing oxidoreductase family iron-sulfur binding subunit
MENINDLKPQPKYWMSLEQWTQDPEFLKMAENEFLSSPLSSEDGKDGWARREFLKLMGASLALTTFGCVRRPAEKIIPYAKRPVEVVPGIPDYYASSYFDGAEGLGIVVQTREGRPIKIEGNTEHPANEGGMSARAHAHILKLYDPDRATGPLKNLQNEKKTNNQTVNITWDKLDQEVVEQLKKGKVAFLTATIASPATKELIQSFASQVGGKTYEMDEIPYEAVREGQKLSYGDDVVPQYRIDKAKYILAVNNDFIGTWLTPVAFQKMFSKTRNPDENMSKLTVVESLLSLTGSNADERFRIKPSQTLDFLMGLAYQLNNVMKVGGATANADILSALKEYAQVDARLGLKEGTIARIAEEIAHHRGESLVLSGGMTTGGKDAVAIQVVTNLINSILGNEGTTVLAGAPLNTARGSYKQVSDLMKAIKDKSVETLIIYGVNPTYALPEASGFQEALRNVPVVIYAGDRKDETGFQADYIPTVHHELENWGDLETSQGVFSLQQPTIQPLYDTRSFQDSLLAWAKGLGKKSARLGSENWHEYLKSYWKSEIYPKVSKAGTFDNFWVDSLKSGVVNLAKKDSSHRSFKAASFSTFKKRDAVPEMELVLYPTVGLRSGELANVSWMQEFPDPVTKLVWDNYFTFSIGDAKKLKLSQGRMVSVKVNGQTIEGPAHIQPGQAEGVVGLAVGYGRTRGGKVCDGVGINAFNLAQPDGDQLLTAGFKAEVTPLSKRYDLATTQGHNTMEGRQIVVEETLAQFMKKPGGQIHHPKMMTMWSEHKYPGRKWAMTIDLNKCTGCSACLTACQSENNIPTVGKKYVLQGREMHWLRIDRYYTGEPEDAGVVNQPIVCMHCDNAPCETVCPVAATTHSDEGTNDMIYNRCVGTRYCSNNCPYKVRRFNWFSYTDVKQPLNLAMNPEVTVRNRGVMEKCTFCIHRIKFEESQAKMHDRELKDGDVKTACQESCPTNAIIFGNINDPNSEVAKRFKQPMMYDLLEELNTKPSVRYHTKVRNAAQIKSHGKEEHNT